jgi:hypothetical protein
MRLAGTMACGSAMYFSSVSGVQTMPLRFIAGEKRKSASFIFVSQHAAFGSARQDAIRQIMTVTAVRA